MLILDRDICLGCKCVRLWYDIDLTFDLALVMLNFKILSGLYVQRYFLRLWGRGISAILFFIK